MATNFVHAEILERVSHKIACIVHQHVNFCVANVTSEFLDGGIVSNIDTLEYTNIWNTC